MRYVLALALFGLTAVAPITAVPAAAQSVATEQTVTFAVDNMTRALCPITVQRAMEGVEGVTAVEIDFEAGRVVFDTHRANRLRRLVQAMEGTLWEADHPDTGAHFLACLQTMFRWDAAASVPPS